MSASVIITASTAQLRETWAQQLPGPDSTPAPEALAAELRRPGARVWIKDLSASQAGLPVHGDTVVIAIGESDSVPFAEARRSRGVSFCLSYDEGRQMLSQVVANCCELAERRTVSAVLTARQSLPRASAAPFPSGAPSSRGMGDCDFIELALDHLAERPLIVDAFRRGLRKRLRASKVAVFLREGADFASGAEGWHCAATDPLVAWLREHAAIVDAETIEQIEEPLTSVRVHQLISTWNARLLIPLEGPGGLGGWVALGPRADARAYSREDYDEALALASLLGRMLCQHLALQQAQAAAAAVQQLNALGPKYLLVRRGTPLNDELPIEVREVLGQARREHRRVDRDIGRLRISAGPLGGTGDFWVLSDPDGGQAVAYARKLEAERFRTLHDLGLILSHEQSNALFSFATYFQHQSTAEGRPASDLGFSQLVRQVESDMGRLKQMPHLLDAVYEMTQRPTAEFDMRRLVNAVAKEVDGLTDISDAPVRLHGHEENLREALVWLCKEIKVGRDSSREWPPDKIRLRLQERGRDENRVCLVFVGYVGLRLDQIKSGAAETVDELPTTAVYLAREVIRYHFGTIHVGQGIDGPELCISLKSRYDVADARGGAGPLVGQTVRVSPATSAPQKP